MREMISKALTEKGHRDKAYLVTDPASAIMRPPKALPGGAQVVRFDAFPHPARSFYVGIAGDEVFYLTETPDAFSAMMRASGHRVTADDAITIARLYVETTRSMSRFARVVDGVNDIEWATGPLAPPPPKLDALIDRLRGVVTPPKSEARENDHLVTLYALNGSTLERRRITISGDGSVRERSERISKNLPVPVST